MSVLVPIVWMPVTGAVVMVLFAIKVYAKFSSGRCTCATNLSGCTALITGATSGIGRETAVRLAAAGARLIIPVRNQQRGQALVEYVSRVTGKDQGQVQLINCDLSRLSSIRELAAQVLQFETRLDLLILNAGMVPPPGRFYTEDGLELQMAANHFGHFLLVNLLLPLMRRTAFFYAPPKVDQSQSKPSQCSVHNLSLINPRIVVVSSSLHPFGQIRMSELTGRSIAKTRDPFWNYCDSKLANLMMVRRLSDLLRSEGSAITVNGLHPGLVRTEINRQTPFYVKYMIQPVALLWSKTAQEGAQTTLHLSLAPSLAQVSGRYFSDCGLSRWSSKCDNQGLAQDFWTVCEQLTGLKEKQPQQSKSRDLESV